jgi:hypothetical protein
MSYYVPQSFSVSCGTLYSGAGNNSIECTVNVNDKTANAGEIAVISSAIREAIQRYGQPVEYYINQYNTLSANNLYGEDPTKSYYPPVQIIMYIQLTENSATLRRFGFDPDDEVTAFVHISGYAATFNALSSVYQDNNQAIQPKSGDVFQLKQYGSTRPGDREGKFFEVTTIDDQDIAEMNYLGAHYMWRLRARRLDYSFEPGLPNVGGRLLQQTVDSALTLNDSATEVGLNDSVSLLSLFDQVNTVEASGQVFDNARSGRIFEQTVDNALILNDSTTEIAFNDSETFLSLFSQLSTTYPVKAYNQDINVTSEQMVFDQRINNTDIYGLYG